MVDDIDYKQTLSGSLTVEASYIVPLILMMLIVVIGIQLQLTNRAIKQYHDLGATAKVQGENHYLEVVDPDRMIYMDEHKEDRMKLWNHCESARLGNVIRRIIKEREKADGTAESGTNEGGTD